METRRCSDCVSHSGVEIRLDAHGEILKTFESRMYQLFVGVMLTLLTGIVSVGASLYVASQTRPYTPRTYSAYESLVDIDQAIIRRDYYDITDWKRDQIR